ncbi:hypothetical protein ND2E_0714 [Colwellia psychrerythraea]|uniref:Uncharacterized protein n=1 Tax=Colwellia psychrerythraea TaxID=28229 RepID=A0A099KB69_COLPS|nr:hypothetical protein ND2E_0714 [Colwellia psychrerythraea]
MPTFKQITAIQTFILLIEETLEEATGIYLLPQVETS